MNQANWQQVKEIFHQARELAPEKRAEFLDEVCAGNDELREQVEILLDSYESDFLEETAIHKVTEIISGSSLKIGQQIGHYEIKEILGTGGMGEVFLAEDTELKRLVAVKILHAEVAADQERISRFIREARAASALNHPNILTIHEIGNFEDSRFIVSEYVKGKTLREKLKEKKITIAESLEIASQIAVALEAAHEAGIVHRDIKPENIMLRNDGLVKVLDFGLAKLLERKGVGEKGSRGEDETTKILSPHPPVSLSPHLTTPGVVMGTVAYMSPEQARGVAVDARTDIWSLGVVLYETLSGKLPFPGETTSDIIASILKTEVEPLENLNKEIPPEIEAICLKSLTKNVNERYQTAQELLQDLRQAKKNLENANEQTATKQFNYSDERKTKLIRHRSTLSKEYLVSQVKQHKRGISFSAIGLFILILVVFGFYKNFAPSSKAINSVAVLPFENEGGNQDIEYLSDGLSENLIDRLSLLSQLKVISRSSSFKYKGKEINLQEAANALGVQAIVTGRVTQRGDNFVVRVELTDANNKTQLWGEQYTRKISDIQILQEEIAKRVSEKLRLRLSGEDLQNIEKEPTQNPDAYQHYLYAKFYSEKGTYENAKKAINHLNQAISLDPNFARAYAALAGLYEGLGNDGEIDPKDALPKAKAARSKALELDSTSADAHFWLGRVKELEWKWKDAEADYRRGLELNPSRGHSLLASILSITGRHDEALAEAKKNNEINPLDIWGKFSEGYLLNAARRYDESIKVCKEVLELEPNFSGAHWQLAYSYEQKEMYPEAIAEYRKFMEIEKEESTQTAIVNVLAKSGKRDEALEMLEKVKTLKEYIPPAEWAIPYLGLGDREKALELLEKAYDEHDGQLIYITTDARYDSLRNEPRFQEIVRKVGLPPNN